MIRVMVIDDSALVRKIAADILSADPDMCVVAAASQAEFALPKLDKEKPDVITLDIEMPGMGGLEAIRRIMAVRPTPIVVLSSHAQKGAELTLQALDLGAVDFVPKPSASLSGGLTAIAEELREKVRAASHVALTAAPGPAAPPAAPALSMRCAATPPRAAAEPRPLPDFAGETDMEVIAVGASTGGPVALKTVLSMLPADLPVGVVVVQHMPPVFTKAFADRLDSCCEVLVKEAVHGDAILPGRVLLAPGDWHMTVSRFGGAARVELNKAENVNGHRPSVDVLMHSVAMVYGSRAAGVIMTGMGKDGAQGFNELHRHGGWVIAQDRGSSVIYGMNREVVQNGDADETAPAEQIAQRLMDLLHSRAPSRKVI